MEQDQEIKKSWFGTKLIFAVVACLALIFVMFGVFAYSYVNAYEKKVYPGLMIGQYEIGKMTRNEVHNFIENLNNRYAKEGIDVVVDNSTAATNKVKLSTISSGGSALEVISIDSDTASDEAVSYYKSGNFWQKYLLPLKLFFSSEKLKAPLIVRSEFSEIIKDTLHPFEIAHQDAGLKNINEELGSAQIVPEKSGSSFNNGEVLEKVKLNLQSLSFSPVHVDLKKFEPTVKENDVESILPKLKNVLAAGPVYINVSSTIATRTEWVLEPKDIKSMIVVRRTDNNNLVFSLNKEKILAYLQNIVLPEVEVAPESAKFRIEDNKVKEFKPSQNGLTVDLEKSSNDIVSEFENRNESTVTPNRVMIELVSKSPEVETSDINSFGIVEIIGVGTSTFKDSHSRRIKNIAHAVERLNGTLIQPGEEFSAIKYAGPFTAENGYLPEAIIKGKEIKDEIGGGMCQIGTTLFRMAMNGGFDITQRRNHSLVVSYYSDPVNGNPGTDAALYEPYLDLKFLNDTKNYLLLTTNIDYKKQMLTFSLWGTNDGRSGSYTHPKVSKWIAAPKETEYIVTDKMKPGEEKCQPAYRGAVASFTYTRTTPEGQKIERVFDSYYRPLPKICTIGPTTTPAVVSTSL